MPSPRSPHVTPVATAEGDRPRLRQKHPLRQKDPLRQRARSYNPANLLRSLSRTRSTSENLHPNQTSPTSPTNNLTRTLSRRQSVCDKLVRQKSPPKFGSRAKTGPISLSAKQRVLQKYPALQVVTSQHNDRAEQAVFHGANSIRAEIIDLNTMLLVMEDNAHMLTHAAVDRFFEWIPLFQIYLERYMLVEESLLVRWVESKGTGLRGPLSPSARMVARGKIQKQVHDIAEVQDKFVTYVPAGQRLGLLADAVHVLTRDVIDFFRAVGQILPKVMHERCSRSELSKARLRIVKHVVNHVGYQDFLALYTRWMTPGELLEWKTSVLLPCDFKFFSYASWEKDMDAAHYQIAASFGEVLREENRADEEAQQESKMDFERARATRMQMSLREDGLDVELAEEEEMCELDEEVLEGAKPAPPVHG